MARMYTLDDKLLCGSPEIRIGDNVFPIDDRQKTVKKALKIFGDKKKNKDAEGASNHEDFEKIDELFRLAFGKRYAEIEKMELSFAAYQELTTIIISAMIGEDEEEIKKKKEEKEKKDSSFPGDVV